MTFDPTQHMYDRYRPCNPHLARINDNIELVALCDELPQAIAKQAAYRAALPDLLRRLDNQPDKQKQLALQAYAALAKEDDRIRQLKRGKPRLNVLSDLHSLEIELGRAA